MSVKFTEDGKKVSVIAKIDDTQYMVQEIFIDSDGLEFPSGKTYLESQLFDKPVLTWKEKNLLELNNNYESQRNQLEEKTRRMRKEQEHEQVKLCSLTRSIRDVNKQLYADKFQTLFDFINGNIKYLVVIGFSDCRIEKFEPAISNNSQYDTEGLKLISLYGGSKGDLQWRLNQYSDTSGSSQTIIPCISHEQAVLVLDGLVEDACSKHVWQSHIDAKEKYGLKNPTDEQVKAFNDDKIKSVTDRMNKLENDKTKLQLELKGLVGE